MYAIVRNRDGTHYNSVVFGYFCKITASDDYEKYLEGIHNQFYVVLDESKNHLVKKYVFPSDNKYLDPQILIMDTEQQEWILDESHHGCEKFLYGTDFDAEEIEVPPTILEMCVEMDAAQEYSDIVEVKNKRDIDNLYCVSGSFHDAYIKEYKVSEQEIYVLFDGVWGCKIEVWFEGDPTCCIRRYDPEYREEDPTWYDSTIIHANDYFYLVDECEMTVEDITDEYCWFKGHRLKYRVIPNK